MCGILGIVSGRTLVNRDISTFEAALNLQKHRGPDDKGVSSLPNALLGHRRLSIIDLDKRASQPMASACERFSIVFNGEIYNYRELKHDLEKAGKVFKTESDTEVLLTGLVLEGLSFIKKCIGMFAFCFNDSHKKKAYLVRDRLGIKPLYYSLRGDIVYFSSAVQSLQQLLINDDLTPSLTSLSSYLSYRYPIQENTFINSISSLEPGSYLEVSNCGIKKFQYWDPSEFIEDQFDRGESYYSEKLNSLLSDSVRLRMIADVPVGAYLSGGVDSSALVSIMSKQHSSIKTYTTGFNEVGYNEFSYAEAVSDRFGTDHTEVLLNSNQYLDDMTKLISLKGAPLSVPNEVPIWILSKELKKHISVVLSGEGADELFMGYGKIFRSAHDYRRMEDKYVWTDDDNKKSFFDASFKKYGSNHFSKFSNFFLNRYKYTKLADKYQYLSGDVGWQAIEDNLDGRFHSLFNKVSEWDFENQISYVFIKMHLPGLLQRLDSSTMAASVEGRVPFVDHRIVEFALTIPVKHKLKWISDDQMAQSEPLLSDEISERFDIPKSILKKTFEGTLDNDTLYRKKMGFPVPLHRWIGSGFSKTAKEVLLTTKARQRGIYNNDALEKSLNQDDFFSDHGSALKLWMLVNYEIYLNTAT